MDRIITYGIYLLMASTVHGLLSDPYPIPKEVWTVSILYNRNLYGNMSNDYLMCCNPDFKYCTEKTEGGNYA